MLEMTSHATLRKMQEACDFKRYKWVKPAMHIQFSLLIGQNDVVLCDVKSISAFCQTKRQFICFDRLDVDTSVETQLQFSLFFYFALVST